MMKQIGGWTMQIGPKKSIPGVIANNLSLFLADKWKEAIIRETDMPWYSLTEYGVPSPIIRIDMAPPSKAAGLENLIYEVEARPAGLGIMLSLDPKRVATWKAILKAFNCCGFVNIDSPVEDDLLAANALGLPYFNSVPNDSGIYWIRMDGPGNGFEKRSIVPIAADGDKRYLSHLGMAQIYAGQSLDWGQGFAIKPLQGCRMRGVEIYTPGKHRGSSTKTKIEKRLTGTEKYLIQPLIMPLEEIFGGSKGFTIYRLYFGWLDGGYRYIGGLWNWRPTMRVHGATDALVGVVENLG